jgi:hypothetical protein
VLAVPPSALMDELGGFRTRLLRRRANDIATELAS